jgi:hypothetical protein
MKSEFEGGEEEVLIRKALQTGHNFQEEGYRYMLKLQGYFSGSKRSRLGQFLKEDSSSLLARLLSYYKGLSQLLLSFQALISLGLAPHDLTQLQNLRDSGLSFSALHPNSESG